MAALARPAVFRLNGATAASRGGRPTMPDPKRPDDEPEADEELDEALEETFPASDPIAPSIPSRDDRLD
jgi:hypothetical protein